MPSQRNTADDAEAEQEARQIDGACAAEDAPAEAIDDADHRIEAVQKPPLLRHDRLLRSRPATHRARAAR